LSITKNILVTGANGQLGMEFRQLKNDYKAFNFLFVSKEELPIDNMIAVDNYFCENNIAYCINCAAYTAVDKAEVEKDIAITINGTAVGNLSAICKKYNAKFIHFSTDYVFDGNATNPYSEISVTCPINFYGETKLLGEQLAFENNDDTIVIRTSWVYSSFSKNFVKTMIRLMAEKQSIAVVADQIGCPTYAADIADAVIKIIVSNKNIKGIYNYCNEATISWYDFAIEINRLIKSSCIVNAIPTSAYPLPANRPQYGVLDTSKIKSAVGIDIPFWKDSLQKCIAKINS
jgi:dTDP-4-dehydrorhamnose reductase